LNKTESHTIVTVIILTDFHTLPGVAKSTIKDHKGSTHRSYDVVVVKFYCFIFHGNFKRD